MAGGHSPLIIAVTEIAPLVPIVLAGLAQEALATVLEPARAPIRARAAAAVTWSFFSALAALVAAVDPPVVNAPVHSAIPAVNFEWKCSAG